MYFITYYKISEFSQRNSKKTQFSQKMAKKRVDNENKELIGLNLCKMLVLDAFYNILRNERIWSKEFREILILVRQNRQIIQKIKKKKCL